MPPRRKPAAPPKKATSLSALIQSDPEDEIEEVEEVTPAPKKRGLAKKATTAAAKGKKKVELEEDGVIAIVVKKPPPKLRGKKAAPKSRGKKVVTPEPEVEEGDDEIEDEEEELVKKAPAAKPKAAPKPRGKKQVIAPEPESEEDDGEEEEEEEEPPKKPTPAKSKAAPKPRGKKAAVEPEPEPEVVKKATTKKRTTKKEKEVVETPETQMAMEIDDEMEIAPTPTQVHSKGMIKPARKRDAEDDDDDDELGAPAKGKRRVNGTAVTTVAAARFKLEEQRTISAEKALAEFKKNSEEVMKESEKVIIALREDLVQQTSLASESRSFKKKLQAKDADIAKLQAKITELNKTISSEKKETQILQAKLAAASQKAQIPGSAIKNNAMGRGILPGAKAGVGSTTDQAWASHMKEELYSDLTNLMVMSVKKEPENTLFECLQTGNNGALHFKLSAREPPTNNPKKQKAPAAVADSSDDNSEEYVFFPILDEERDKLVISLLPDYLKGEISFSRDHAVRFYQKIHTVLMKPQPVEEEDSEDDEEDSSGQEEDAETTVADETIVTEADTTMPDSPMELE